MRSREAYAARARQSTHHRPWHVSRPPCPDGTDSARPRTPPRTTTPGRVGGLLQVSRPRTTFGERLRPGAGDVPPHGHAVRTRCSNTPPERSTCVASWSGAGSGRGERPPRPGGPSHRRCHARRQPMNHRGARLSRPSISASAVPSHSPSRRRRGEPSVLAGSLCQPDRQDMRRQRHRGRRRPVECVRSDGSPRCRSRREGGGRRSGWSGTGQGDRGDASVT